MLGDAFFLLALAALGAVIGLWTEGWPSWAPAALLGLGLGVVLLGWNQWQVLRWLRRGAPPGAGRYRGAIGEVVERVVRLLQLRDRQMQQERARLQDFRQAIEASPNGVTLLDATGRIEWCNEAASQHLGLQPERDRLQHVTHLVRDPAFMRLFARDTEVTEVMMDGRSASLSQPVRLQVQRHPYGQGQTLLLSRDVSATVQAEAMRRDFVANVSHEIRTPLTVMSGFIETLQSLPLSAQEQAQYLGLMQQQAQRMQALVSDLLTLSQLEGSPVPGRHSQVALAPLMVQLQAEARGLSAAQHGGQAAHDIEVAPPLYTHFLGVEGELHSAMSNLLSNAVRYTPAGGRISAGWRQDTPHEVIFWVRDSGPGIAPEHLPRLSERFYRVDRSRSRETGGTGLGLAITKHVVQRHGGQLRIESQPGQGSTFMLIFPANRFDATH